MRNKNRTYTFLIALLFAATLISGCSLQINTDSGKNPAVSNLTEDETLTDEATQEAKTETAEPDAGTETVNKEETDAGKTAEAETEDEIETETETSSETAAEFEGLLHAGSVVLLENSTKRVMIIGVCQMQANTEGNVIWDYAGCLYPEGYLGEDQTYLFNSNQIDQVFSLGYQDDEQQKFKAMADNALIGARGEDAASLSKLNIESAEISEPFGDSAIDFEGLLPAGSVVILKDSTKRVMIMGVCQMQKDTQGEVIWDYSGCLYPEGYLGANQTYLFNGSQIDKIFSIGYQDEEQLNFKINADETLAKLRDN